MKKSCLCGCGRTWRPLNKKALYHPECNGVPLERERVRRAYTYSPPEDAAAIEARWQAVRAGRRMGRAA